MANRFILKNNFSTTLPAGITAAQTAVTVADATGLVVPVAGRQSLRLTLENPADPSANEIVNVLNVTGNDLVIARAQEGTAAAIWAAGTKVELRQTAGISDGMLQGMDTSGDVVRADALDIQVVRTNSAQIATGSSSVAVGNTCTALGSFSIALGTGSVSPGNDSVIIGNTMGDPNSPEIITGRALFKNIGIGASKRMPFSHAAHYYGYDYIHINSTDQIFQNDNFTTAQLAVREVTLTSPPLQFGDAAWPGAVASVKHSHCVRIGSYSYMAYRWAGATPGGYWGAGNTGAVEPVWPTPDDEWISDGDLMWVSISPTFQFAMPDYARFTPTSIGVIAAKSTPGGSVVYPQITAGPVGDTTAWLTATTQSKLTGDMSNHFTAAISTVGAKTFVAAISTAGSDLNCVGQLVIRGYVVESDVA